MVVSLAPWNRNKQPQYISEKQKCHRSTRLQAGKDTHASHDSIRPIQGKVITWPRVVVFCLDKLVLTSFSVQILFQPAVLDPHSLHAQFTAIVIMKGILYYLCPALLVWWNVPEQNG